MPTELLEPPFAHAGPAQRSICDGSKLLVLGYAHDHDNASATLQVTYGSGEQISPETVQAINKATWSASYAPLSSTWHLQPVELCFQPLSLQGMATCIKRPNILHKTAIGP